MIRVFIFLDKFQEVQLRKNVWATNNKYFIGITAKFLLSHVQQFRYYDNLTLEKSSPKTGNFAFYQKKASIKWTDLGDVFKNAFKDVCTSAIIVSPDPLSTTPLIHSL